MQHAFLFNFDLQEALKKVNKDDNKDLFWILLISLWNEQERFSFPQFTDRKNVFVLKGFSKGPNYSMKVKIWSLFFRFWIQPLSLLYIPYNLK